LRVEVAVVSRERGKAESQCDIEQFRDSKQMTLVCAYWKNASSFVTFVEVNLGILTLPLERFPE